MLSRFGTRLRFSNRRPTSLLHSTRMARRLCTLERMLLALVRVCARERYKYKELGRM